MTAAKAIAAFCTTAAAGITGGISDGHLTAVEIIVVALGSIAAGALTWTVPNKASA